MALINEEYLMDDIETIDDFCQKNSSLEITIIGEEEKNLPIK